MTQATKADIGKWCKFWDDKTDKTYVLAKLFNIEDDYFYYQDNNYVGGLPSTEFCTPLTQEQIKVLGLEE